ncbi:hypothetical protein D3C73_1030430 [compost metagenome]
MSAHQCSIAQIQTFIKDAPKIFHISARGQGHIHQINGDYSLIESPVVFGPVGLWVHIGSQERAATHTGVTVPFTVFIHFVLQHDLFRNIVWNHSPSGTLGRQLGEVIVWSAGAHIVLFQHIN